jgi:hypothetical protein
MLEMARACAHPTCWGKVRRHLTETIKGRFKALLPARRQRTEEAIVVASGAPREAGCLPWIVLGVKALDAPSVRAA